VSRKLQLLLFLCGSAVFAYLVARIGVEQLLADAVRTGWLFLPIVLPVDPRGERYGTGRPARPRAQWLRPRHLT